MPLGPAVDAWVKQICKDKRVKPEQVRVGRSKQGAWTAMVQGQAWVADTTDDALKAIQTRLNA